MCPLSIMVCHVKPVSSRLARLMMSPFFTCAHERQGEGQVRGEQQAASGAPAEWANQRPYRMHSAGDGTQYATIPAEHSMPTTT